MGARPDRNGAAKMLCAAGFQVAGWVRNPRPGDGVEIFSGGEYLAAFLARSKILVNLLPLMPETSGSLNAETLRALPAGAAIVNLGRGEHIVEEDLIAALDSEHLAAATLDVFSGRAIVEQKRALAASEDHRAAACGAQAGADGACAASARHC